MQAMPRVDKALAAPLTGDWIGITGRLRSVATNQWQKQERETGKQKRFGPQTIRPSTFNQFGLVGPQHEASLHERPQNDRQNDPTW
jgi:hypothetical protein